MRQHSYQTVHQTTHAAAHQVQQVTWAQQAARCRVNIEAVRHRFDNLANALPNSDNCRLIARDHATEPTGVRR
jgi:hypothetical protein